MKFISYTNCHGERWTEMLPDESVNAGVTTKARLASIRYHVSRYGGQIHAIFTLKQFGRKL